MSRFDLESLSLLDGFAAREVLEAVVERAGAGGHLVVFDLDSTLLDNSPRQARIMADYGREHDAPLLAAVTAEHWEGWDAKIPMRNAGLDESEVERHFAAFRQYWWERFFTSSFCELDRPIAGAPEYACAVRDAGARLFYVTGRHEAMRDGTVSCFAAHGLPIPDGGAVQLLMKPTLDEHDDDYKHRTYRTLETSGVVVGAFDNEPTHINGYRRAFPEATVIHLATDHSARDVPLAPGIASIRDFSSWLKPDP